MEVTKQEPMGSAAETGALRDEELKDVAGGVEPSPPLPAGVYRWVFSCPVCGWSGEYMLSSTKYAFACSCAKHDHEGATNHSCTGTVAQTGELKIY